MKVDLVIKNQYPAVAEGIEWSLERQGVPGKLTFTVVKDNIINFAEGDFCRLAVDGTDIFYGYVFTKSRSGKADTVDVIAYDQLRYLKNKEILQYENKTATEVIMMLAGDYKLNTGDIEDTGHKIPQRVENNITLFDIIQNALDETLIGTGKMYVLYDDAGRLTLKNVESMKLDLLIDEDTMENFDYKSTIDDSTYNQIKIYYEDSGSGMRTIFMAKDGANINQWGVLQHLDSVEDKFNGQAKADSLLALYNEKTRALSANNVLGDIRVRAGSSIMVSLNLGDIVVSHFMMVESVRHIFNEEQHLMNLKLRGGTFVA